ncbi:FkbM family methyltransferase [Sulfuriferula sp.]|uniref:FkbM family methyltransferase n=1 Tax=Sulfuriferula sp. TaxID=2025307 RepID=UPI002731F5C2|nr:FkbM family methyltransferase [Sulfuriferula sp.]MDP2025573.1 FkbM family methyltransferase [Sulfuriferula sp.]
MHLMKHWIKRGFRQFGLELSTCNGANKAGLRPDMESVLDIARPATVFDVGANKGQFRDFLRCEVGYGGDILSFEPIPELAEALAERAKSDSHWKVFPCALGAEPSTLALNVSDSTDFSSFLKVSGGTQALFPGASSQRTVQVPVQTLTDFTKTNRQDAPFFLKLDTQGFDMNVIKGGLPVMQDCAAVLCEVSVIPLYEGQPTWREMITYLEALGFSIVGLYPVNRTRSMQVIEFDCLMINSRFATPVH